MQAKVANRSSHRRLALAATAAGVVVALIAALVIAKALSGGNSSTAGGSPDRGSGSSVVRTVAALPQSAFDKAGAGSSDNQPRQLADVAELTVDGKPEVLYVGAEFCPFCASVTWGLVVALERFGDFTRLDLTTSASDDVYPDTPTFTFHDSAYTSRYLSFRGYELSDREHQELDSMAPADGDVFQTYDSPPYTSSAGSIPFIDVNGRWLLSGATYDPQLLHGKTQQAIARLLHSPSSPLSEAVLSEANLITASICSSTDFQPTAVCSSPGVKAAASRLGIGG